MPPPPTRASEARLVLRFRGNPHLRWGDFRILNVIDEFARECLAIRTDRKLNSTAVVNVLTDLFVLRGLPGRA